MQHKFLTVILLLLYGLQGSAQTPLASFRAGEVFSDRHKYSTVLAMANTPNGGNVVVRRYYGGMVVKPKGYLVEVYGPDMDLLADYNYKLPNTDILEAFVANGQLYLLELTYDQSNGAYTYVVHHSPLEGELGFKKRQLLAVPAKEVNNPLAVTRSNSHSRVSFSTQLLFSQDKKAFTIMVKADDRYKVYLYGADLVRRFEYDFSAHLEDRNYAFEGVAVGPDLGALYAIGRAYPNQRRFGADERRYRYELVKFDGLGHVQQPFEEVGVYPSSLTPVLSENQLAVVGFYAGRKGDLYDGLAYYRLNAVSLTIADKKFSPFSSQFMQDKFGREDEKAVKNLIFKDARYVDDGILLTAEEYFVTQGMDQSSTGTRVAIDRYHYNDIICAKLTEDGNMQWARNINKTEVTQGDGAYASYATYYRDNTLYMFINSGENPQMLGGGERVMFKQSYSRNPNLFVLGLDGQGNFSYEKLIDDKEVRLPIMVSIPLHKPDGNLLFYAKRGSKKQLVNVTM